MGFILTKYKKSEDIHWDRDASCKYACFFSVRFFFVFDDLLICRHHIINSEWCVVCASGHSRQFVLLKNAWSLSPVCALVLRWLALLMRAVMRWQFRGGNYVACLSTDFAPLQLTWWMFVCFGRLPRRTARSLQHTLVWYWHHPVQCGTSVLSCFCKALFESCFPSVTIEMLSCPVWCCSVPCCLALRCPVCHCPCDTPQCTFLSWKCHRGLGPQ